MIPPSAPTRLASLAFSLLVGIAAAPAHGQSSSTPRFDASVRAELDEAGGAAYGAALGYALTDRAHLRFEADLAESGDAANARSTGWAAGFGYDFGVVDVRLGVDRWADPDLLTAEAVEGALRIAGDSFHATVFGSVRRSEFEPVDLETTVTLPGGRTQVLATSVGCRIDDTGYGARLGYAGLAWSAYVTARRHEYDELSCSTAGTALPGAQRPTTGGLRQLPGAAQVLANVVALRMGGFVGSGGAERIGADHALLEGSVGAGIGFRPGATGLFVDWRRARDQAEGLTTDTVSATLARELSASVDLEFTVGASDAELLGSTAYGGVALYASF